MSFLYCSYVLEVMVAKKFYSDPKQIKEIALGYGGCLATDRITVDGCRVGMMYRENPINPMDSGWRFIAGDESEEYMSDDNNLNIYDVNTIANIDAGILNFLHEPVGSAIERDDIGEWRHITLQWK